MGGKRSASRPGFAPGKTSRYPLNKAAAWAPEPDHEIYRRVKNFIFVGGVSDHNFSVTILAELS